MNTPYLSQGIEKEIRDALAAHKRVSLSISVVYDGRSSGIPTKLEYRYSVIGSGVVKNCTVHNESTGGRTTGDPSCPRI